jgi:hypothetical protein
VTRALLAGIALVRTALLSGSLIRFVLITHLILLCGFVALPDHNDTCPLLPSS